MDNVCVTIIGGNPWADTLDEEMARLHGLREQLGLHDLVTFAGSRDQDLLPYYYAAAEMVVMPSHYESFGMVALEKHGYGYAGHRVRGGWAGAPGARRLQRLPRAVARPAALAARILDVLECEGCRRRLGRQALSRRGLIGPRLWRRCTAYVEARMPATCTPSLRNVAPTS
ncbi:MAG: glycosyltransferase [Caldilineaceae bacterium]